MTSHLPRASSVGGGTATIGAVAHLRPETWAQMMRRVLLSYPRPGVRRAS